MKACCSERKKGSKLYPQNLTDWGEEIKPVVVTCNEQLLAKRLKTVSSHEEIYKLYSMFFPQRYIALPHEITA